MPLVEDTCHYSASVVVMPTNSAESASLQLYEVDLTAGLKLRRRPGWNDEHFLWGLFCHIGQDTDGCAEGGSDKVIDTEIDMIAGENVGTSDIVVSTAARTVVTPQDDLEDTHSAREWCFEKK